MKTAGMIWILVPGVLLLGCDQTSVDLNAAQAELRAAADAYHEAAESVDVENLVALYTTDGLILPPNAAKEEGLEGVRGFADAFTQTPGFSVQFADMSVEVAASGDMGYSLANAVISVDGPNGEPVEDRVRDFHLWKKQDGTWKVAIDIWNSELPLPEADDPLEGAWRVTRLVAADGTVTDPAGPGQFIFKDGRYSAVYTIDTFERPRSTASFNPTDSEKVAQYDTIIVNSGTYTISGSKITLRPVVAKSPEYIGGESTMELSMDGDMLVTTIDTLASIDGVTPDDAVGSSMTLRRVE